jgi:voltage-dependent potassium channel beta subunit
MDIKKAIDCMGEAYDAGVNFFDNAEVYAQGKAEVIMGQAFRELGWDRDSYIVSSKYFWGIKDGANLKSTLNRKYLLSAIESSLDRLDLDYLDLVYCHRHDPETPIEEIVWTMHDIVDRGLASYWGTSEWPAEQIAAAYEYAEKYRLRKPVMEQPEYNLFRRDRVEVEYAPLYERYGLGLTTWSPLASGVLTGKYRDGIPEDSRGTLKGYEWLQSDLLDEHKRQATERLRPVALELGCTLAQLAIAWCLKNPRVSTVITGASRPEQVRENMKALKIAEAIDDSLKARIEALIKGA